MKNILWIFETIFDQLVKIGSINLLTMPFTIIEQKTFNNQHLLTIIAELTKDKTDNVKKYLDDNKYKFLFSKLKNHYNVRLLLCMDLNLDLQKYRKKSTTSQLAVVNNKLDLVKKLISDNVNHKHNNYEELIKYAIEFGYNDIYYYLKSLKMTSSQGQIPTPNLSLLRIAVETTNLEIIKDIYQFVGPTKNIIEEAFKTNSDDVILFFVEKEPQLISKNFMSYLILNNNLTLLNKLGDSIEWHDELYYSALLSGSMEMIKFVESKMPTIHHNHLLDVSAIRKGQKTLLLNEMIYNNGKTYFSHTMNYAVQSNNLEIVKYIHQLNYGSTVSNLITAIRQSDISIVKYLLENFKYHLKPYIMLYFSFKSYIPQKMEKAKLVLEYIDFDYKYTVDDYRLENTHIELINKGDVQDDNNYDPDLLLQYHLFFTDTQLRLLTMARLFLTFNKLDRFQQLLEQKKHEQLLMNCLFLFGTIEQINKYYTNYQITVSNEIFMQIVCYGNLQKIIFALTKNIIDDKKFMVQLLIMIDNPVTNLITQKYFGDINHQQFTKFVILSGNKQNIIQLIKNNSDINNDDIKNLLLLDDIELTQLLTLTNKQHWIDYCDENDLINNYVYLKN